MQQHQRLASAMDLGVHLQAVHGRIAGLCRRSCHRDSFDSFVAIHRSPVDCTPSVGAGRDGHVRTPVKGEAVGGGSDRSACSAGRGCTGPIHAGVAAVRRQQPAVHALVRIVHPHNASRSDSAWDAYASTASGATRRLSGRRKLCGSPRGTAAADGRRPGGAAGKGLAGVPTKFLARSAGRPTVWGWEPERGRMWQPFLPRSGASTAADDFGCPQSVSRVIEPSEALQRQLAAAGRQRHEPGPA